MGYGLVSVMVWVVGYSTTYAFWPLFFRHYFLATLY